MCQSYVLAHLWESAGAIPFEKLFDFILSGFFIEQNS